MCSGFHNTTPVEFQLGDLVYYLLKTSGAAKVPPAGYHPAILEELLRQDQQEQGMSQPILRDGRQECVDKATAMNGQPILIRILQPGRASISTPVLNSRHLL